VEDDFIDPDAEVLDPNECLTYVQSNEVKDLELDFFNYVTLDSCLYFGGTLGSKSGGVTAFTVSTNGRMVAYALNNGTILVYDTHSFDLARFFQGPSVSYSYLEFSRDNFSQLIAVSEDGMAKSFLLKGQIDLEDQSNAYINPKLPLEEKPLLLLPFYDVQPAHFISAESLSNKGVNSIFQVKAASLHPSISFPGFQHCILVGTKSNFSFNSSDGTILKWNSNVGPDMQ